MTCTLTPVKFVVQSRVTKLI